MDYHMIRETVGIKDADRCENCRRKDEFSEKYLHCKTWGLIVAPTDICGSYAEEVDENG